MTAPSADPRAVAAARQRLAAAGVRVVFEDHLLLGLDKASGVLSQPGPPGEPSLVELVGAYRRDAEGKPGLGFVGLVHRLDRNVSGVLVVGKSSKAASRLAAAFRSRRGVEKTYLAWATRGPATDEGTLRDTLVRDDAARRSRVVASDAPADLATSEDVPPEGAEAVLHYVVEARGASAARLRITLETGATHQIRVQCAAAGFHLLGDAKYGGPAGPASARLSRPALHARRLVVPHPVGGAPVVLEAPVPDDLERLDAALRLAPTPRVRTAAGRNPTE